MLNFCDRFPFPNRHGIRRKTERSVDPQSSILLRLVNDVIARLLLRSQLLFGQRVSGSRRRRSPGSRSTAPPRHPRAETRSAILLLFFLLSGRHRRRRRAGDGIRAPESPPRRRRVEAAVDFGSLRLDPGFRQERQRKAVESSLH